MSMINILFVFFSFLTLVFLTSLLYFNRTYFVDVKLIGSKLDNSEDAIADAVAYFELKNLVELDKKV